MAQSTPVLERSDGRSANLPAAFSLRPSGGRAEPRCNGASPRELDSRWQQLSALLGSRIGRRQALGCADHDQRPPLLVFRRRLHLISREIEGDLVILGGSGRKVERVPINRDLHTEAASVFGWTVVRGDFYDEDEICRAYYPEERLLKDATGADSVLAFNHAVRRRGTADRARQPIARVHVDHKGAARGIKLGAAIGEAVLHLAISP